MKLAKAEAIYKPNLAINGDFQIWQRGEEFTNVANGTRIADMWRVYNLTSPNLSIKKVADGMQVTNVAGYVSIYQTLPEDIYTSSDVFTIVKSVDGVVTVQEATFSESSHQINFGISANSTLNWICLFAGNIAYDHVKEDEAIAQMRSSKYVRTYTGSIGIGSCTLASRIMVALPIDMYELPTITPTSISANVAGTTVLTSDLTLAGSSTKDVVYLVCNFTGNPFTAGQSGTVTVQSGRIILSCEP